MKEDDRPLQIRAEEEYRSQFENKTLAPYYVQWIATHKCNFKCPHCGTAADEAKPDELTTAQILNVIDQLAEMGTQVLSLTGGEAILRPDFPEIMQRCKDVGIKTGFVTNGFAIKENRKMIEEAEPFSVMVSLDGYRDNHDKIRGTKGAYKKAMEALDIFTEMGLPVIATATVYMEENVDEIPLIYEDCVAHGSMRHRIQTIVPEGRAVGMKNDPAIMKKVFKYVYEMKQQGHNIEVCEGHGYLGPLDGVIRPPFFCGCGWNTFTIMADGEVMGCPALEFPKLYSEGNVKEVPIADMWWKGFTRFRETLFDDVPQDCKDCDDLSLCRGACWLQRVNGDYCFIDTAREVAKELGL